MQLKIHTGLHAGASVKVDSAAFVIGRDPQCDVVLADEALEPFHLMVSEEKGRLRVRVFDPHSTLMDGEPIEREAHPGEGSRLSLNGIEVELLLSEPPVLMSSVDFPLDLDEVADPAPPPALPVGQTDPAMVARDEAHSDFKDSVDSAEALLLQPRSQARRRRLALSVACLCVGVVGLTLTYPHLQFAVPLGWAAMGPATLPKTPPKTPPTVFQIRDELNKAGLSEVQAMVDASGRPVLTGYVADDAALAALHTHFLPALQSGDLRSRVETRTAYARSLAAQIDDPGVKVAFESAQKLVLEGAATRPATKSKIIRMEREFSSAFEIETNISYERTATSTETVSSKSAPLQIAHVSGGSDPSLVTPSGQQYFQGAKLVDGTEVVSITTDKVVLKSGERVMEYRFE